MVLDFGNKNYSELFAKLIKLKQVSRKLISKKYIFDKIKIF